MYWKHWTTGTYFSVLLGVLWQYARSRFANQPINSSRTHFQYLSTFSIPIAFSGGGAVSPETFVNS